MIADPAKMSMGSSLIGISGVASQQKIDRREELKTTGDPAVSDGFKKEETTDPGLIRKEMLLLPLHSTKKEEEKPAAPVLSTNVPASSNEASTGVTLNPNGTLSMLDETKTTAVTPDGGVNFARMFGVDGPEPMKPPTKFTENAVMSFYLAEEKGVDGTRTLLSPEGQRLYKAVKAKYLDSVPRCPYGTPTVYLTGGLPGSGKGHILEKVSEGMPQAIQVDPDEIKKDIVRDLVHLNPELKGQIANEKRWGSIVHETSNLMARILMEDALRTGKDIVFDSSMSTKESNKYRKFAEIARSEGYKINAIVIDVSEETANRRALKRAEKPTVIRLTNDKNLTIPGRWTTPDYIAGCTRGLKSNLEAFLSEGLFDHCVIFSNNQDDASFHVSAQYKRVQDASGNFRMEQYGDTTISARTL